MSSNSRYICRLCFGIDDISGGEIEDIHKEILDILLINIDWSLTETPTLCANCCKKLHESFTFKANCIDIEDYLTPMKDNGKLDLREVCSLPKHSNAVDLICRLCVEWVDDQEVTLTEIEKERFKLYLPEIDLESTSNPVICSVCYDLFQSCLSFTESCIQNEQKLVDYCIKQKMTIERTIFLDEFLEYLKSPNSSTRVGHLNRKVRSEKLEWGLDRHIRMEHNYSKVKKKIVYIRQKKHVCSISGYRTSQKSYLRHHIMKRHLDPSQVEMFKCDECPFERKWEHSLSGHKKIHRKPSKVNIFKCDECSYESTRARHVVSHKKVHRKPSELNMFKCEKCPFESKWANSLSGHKKIHRKPSEEKVFKCDECPYESKWAQSLLAHKKIHRKRKPSEVNMFKCEECPFESKWAKSITYHKIKHLKPSEVNMFRCDECPFESKWANSLSVHKKIHRKPSKVNIFKCDECSYESTRARHVVNHKKVHRKPSELNMFKCEKCPFESKWAYYLSIHKKVHRIQS